LKSHPLCDQIGDFNAIFFLILRITLLYEILISKYYVIEIENIF